MVDITSLTPVVSTVEGVLNKLQVLIGGIFGFYVIIFFYKIYATHKLEKKLDLLITDVRILTDRVGHLETGKKKSK